jgi:sortase A
MRVVLRTSSGDVGHRALAWAERLFVIAGVAALGWAAMTLVQSYLTQRFAHESLVAMPPVEPTVLRHAPPATGTPLADLSIPRIHLSAVVLHGSDAHTLRVGAGHIENTAFPGEPGNVAIAGHRDSFFRPLQHVRVGDDVILDTPRERLRYRVSSIRVVQPSEISVLKPTVDATLTLVTCYPFWMFGHAPDRFIVRATRVAESIRDAKPVPVPWPREQALAPVVERPARPGRASASAPTLPGEPKGLGEGDDVALVRQAIERFRTTYNARFTSHGEERAGGPLTFQACRVTLDVDAATATCQSAAAPADPLGVHERTFSLRKIGGVWAIKSFSMLP